MVAAAAIVSILKDNNVYTISLLSRLYVHYDDVTHKLHDVPIYRQFYCLYKACSSYNKKKYQSYVSLVFYERNPMMAGGFPS